ncbi:iron complex outermembrane recepter protein [Methylomarinovum caldicuralii]|uniref:Iron complex outermembrane recepter protein n=1 Tax=Methylomarinovum caldicuralii TaxID=438856 RepID=A0AAU9CD25_9GAMM|nr:TonB-dependent receptor [Methylomarinovum caldicuralii]BCX80840.1 iron complex outermembrane recepter protein [Methylomarinovum caldicuralii]
MSGSRFLLVLFSGAAFAHQATVRLTPLTVTAAHEHGPGRTVLEKEVFQRTLRRNLGEMLEQLPGFSNQSYGPGVGQPVIRGQSGPRVRILQNSLGVNDLSRISPDHAIGLEPLLTEKIEILHGPDALRYGSGIVGGLVNVLDGRIPEQLPTRPVTAIGEYQYDSTADEHAGVARLTGAIGPMVLSAGGARRARGDLVTGAGRLQGTDGDDRNGSLGLSWIGGWGFVGGGLQRLEKDYGVPSLEAADHDEAITLHEDEHEHEAGHTHEDEPGHEEHEDGKIRIDLKQNRYDFRAGIQNPWGWAEDLRLGYGYTDYRHLELEGGERGTLWTQRSHESRLELHHVPWGPARGSLGFQSRNGTMEAEGEEAVVPETDTASYAGFIAEHLDLWPFELDLGMRIEHLTTEAQGFNERHDLPVSGAASLTWNPADRHRLSLAFTSTQRPPAPQELYSFGVHHATQAFEIGNPNLDMEHSNQLELGYRFEHPRMTAEINFFHYWVNDYIFFRNTGRIDAGSGLPIFTAKQQDARFKGFEAQVHLPLYASNYGDLDLILFGDYTRGRFASGGDVPRMPPLRYGFEWKFHREEGEIFLRLTRAEPQKQPGENEASTPGYVLLNLGGEYRVLVKDRARVIIFARATNLLDQVVRSSVSNLRTVAPEPGRGAQVGMRIAF